MKNLILRARKACSAKLRVKQAIGEKGLPLIDDMRWHPGMAGHLDDGFLKLSVSNRATGPRAIVSNLASD